MNIDIIKIHFKDKNLGDEFTYKYLPFEYCCGKLKAFEKIIFCEELDALDPNDTIDDTDRVYPRFAFCTEEYDPWEELPYDYYYKIDYCPFCGEKININIVNEIDKTEAYTNLDNRLVFLKYEVSQTDSVKAKTLFEKEIDEIRKKMDDMWEFGEYRES